MKSIVRSRSQRTVISKTRALKLGRTLRRSAPLKLGKEIKRLAMVDTWQRVDTGLRQFCMNRPRFYRLKANEFAVSLN